MGMERKECLERYLCETLQFLIGTVARQKVLNDFEAKRVPAPELFHLFSSASLRTDCSSVTLASSGVFQTLLYETGFANFLVQRQLHTTCFPFFCPVSFFCQQQLTCLLVLWSLFPY